LADFYPFAGRMKAVGALRTVCRRLADVIFPPEALDGGARHQTSGLSPDGWGKVRFIDGPQCDGCATPFEFDPGSRCPACSAKPRAFDRARAACLYDDASRELVLQFKHADRTDLAPMLALWVGRAASDLLAEADIVVPVPVHPGRLFQRRYNQAAELARPIARRAGLAYLPDTLVRRRATDSQTGKSRSGRKRNVAGAFAAHDDTRLTDKRVLLIDDVLTTGATAEGCARALKSAGARAVDLAVIARVQA